MAFSPNYATDRVLFAASQTGNGLFRSNDGGLHWIEHNAGLPESPTIRSIAVSPYHAEDQTLFIGMRDNGVYRSTDGGLSWNPSSSELENCSIETLAISPEFASDQTILAGTMNQGVFKSTDGGTTWNSLNLSIPYVMVNAIHFSPQYLFDRTVVISVYQGGLYKSCNDGESWTNISDGLLPNLIRDISLSPDYSYDQTIFVGTYNGVYRSCDGGESWQKIQTVNRFENTQDVMDFRGNWQIKHNKYLSGSTCHFAGSSGDTVTFHFVGSALRWVGTKGPNHGIAEIFLDSMLYRTVDLYDSSYKLSVPIVEIQGLTDDWHTVTIHVNGEKNELSSDTYVTVDAFDTRD